MNCLYITNMIKSIKMQLSFKLTEKCGKLETIKRMDKGEKK